MPEKTLKDIISNPKPQFETKKTAPRQARNISPKVIREMVSLIEEGEEIRKNEEVRNETLHFE